MDPHQQRSQDWVEIRNSNPQRRPTLVIYSQKAPILRGFTAWKPSIGVMSLWGTLHTQRIIKGMTGTRAPAISSLYPDGINSLCAYFKSPAQNGKAVRLKG